MRAVGYTRVSTLEQQQKGASLPDQKRRIRAYIEARNWRVVRVYEEAHSARKSDARPVFEQMLHAVLSNGIGVVVVTTIDRLGRNTREIINTFNRLKEKGADVVVIDLGLDTTTSHGRLVFHVMAALAEYESDRIKERTLVGRTAKRARGGYYGGRPPFGYRAEGGELVKDDAEQQTLTRIVALKNQGLSLRAIAETLTHEGQAPRGSGKWTPETLRKITARAATSKRSRKK